MAILADGLYKLDYSANDGSGATLSALVALNRNVLLGSDLNGAMLMGEIGYDSARASYSLRLRIAMTPGGELVTGLRADDCGGVVEVEAELAAGAEECVVVMDIAGTPLAVKLSYVGPLPGHAGGRRRRSNDRHERAAPHPARDCHRSARAEG